MDDFDIPCLIITSDMNDPRKFNEVQVTNQIESFIELLEKRKNKWHNLGEIEARKKMSEFLARHGFSWGIIKTVIKELKT